ncbi:MAG: hypothetical protein K0Q49_2288 [Haloplasmataceae bacterium]|jgi:hypothetical protein|nr:hypothetical protein [Haloplasmataceae bacterium]
MNFDKISIIEYFNYDLEKMIDEFNNYYVLKAIKIPTHIQSLYLYFSHLAENSIQLLINSNYNVKNAFDIVNIPGIYIKPYSTEEINQFFQKTRLNHKHFYGLAGFSMYFFDIFYQYIKFNDAKGLDILFKNIPIVEQNLGLIHTLI